MIRVIIEPAEEIAEDREADRGRLFRNESFAGGYSGANLQL